MGRRSLAEPTRSHLLYSTLRTHMESWEFLLQKEGEGDWLLVTESMSLVAGVYALAARTDTPSMEIDIRLSFQPRSRGQVYPLWRQQFTGRTDGEGFVLLLPAVYLQPGQWEVGCCNDIMAELAGETWQRSLLLQVSSSGAGDEHFWEDEGWLEWEVPPESSAAEESVVLWVANEDVAALEMVAVPLAEEEADGEGVAIAVQGNGEVIEAPTLEPTPPVPQFEITLAQENYMASRGELLVLLGRIEASIPIHRSLASLRLRLRLRDPQTAMLLFEAQPPLPDRVPPAVFSYPIPVPSNCETHLLLGEAILEEPNGEDEQGKSDAGGDRREPDPQHILAQRAFTLSIDQQALINAVLPSSAPDSPPLLPPQGSDRDLASFFPPKLPRVRSPKPDKSPQLPPIPKQQLSEFDREEEAVFPTEVEWVVETADDGTFGFGEELAVELPQDVEIGEETSPSYWEELPQLRIVFGEHESEALRENPTEVHGTGNSREPSTSLGEEAILGVDGAEKSHKQLPTSREEIVVQPLLTWLQPQLTAGKTALVQVQLPADAHSVWVKLWLRDGVTRALLDGPRTLIDFTSNGLGELRAMTQLVIPLGTQEVSLEAIALHWPSGRESAKTAISSLVMPPDLPDFF